MALKLFNRDISMSYVKKNLINNESVVYDAKIHWSIFLPSLFTFIFGIYLSTMNPEANIKAIGIIAIIASIVLGLKALIFKTSTELAVTNKRVIAKTGLIKRDTIELNHSKVESYAVKQSILGRILGFGTITINGTGGVKNPIPNIDSPLEFRNQAIATIDNLQES
jgi:uncharacterized membrane protein YdbT with pleckstrin-like domain